MTAFSQRMRLLEASVSEEEAIQDVKLKEVESSKVRLMPR